MYIYYCHNKDSEAGCPETL